MTLEDENNTYAGGVATGLGEEDADGGTGGSSGGATTNGTAFPSGFSSVKTPMYFINKLLNKLSQILLCTIWIDKGLFDCRV
jgi:hypothetical protein